MLLFSTIVIFAGLLRAAAQTTNATCLASYEWASNSLHQSPCLVAAYALGACVNGGYNVDPLGPSTHYLGPALGNVNACQCSTVSYSLISACGDCQNRTYESWSVWSSNCLTSYLDTFPVDIPPATSIPAWAYLDVNTNDTYNPAQAQLYANVTESTAASKPTTLFTGTFSATVTTTTTAPSASSSPEGMILSDNEVDVIAGAVSGGMIGLVILISLISYLLFRHRRKTKTVENP